jgi:hypothetical protein
MMDTHPYSFVVFSWHAFFTLPPWILRGKAWNSGMAAFSFSRD